MNIVEVESSPDPNVLLRELERPVELPPEFNEFVLMVDVLRESGVWEWMQSVVLSRRAGSYELCDLVLFLCCFFASSTRGESIADFTERTSSFGPELAAVGGRERWITQGSVSRALSAVDVPLAQAVSQHLLTVTNRSIVDSPLCMTGGHRDGEGEHWWVGHWDTKVTTMRKRALPEGDDLPQPFRRVDDLGIPGYPGRKRGELQFSRSVLQGSTSATWVNLDIEPGNGRLSNLLSRTADATVKFLGGPESEKLKRAVVICDGVGGGTTQARELYERGLHFLTRTANYDILETKRVAAKLEHGLWQTVEDSRSGPKREAIEVGTRTMFGGCKVRVIATRFPAKTTGRKKQRGAGRTIGEWQYELFITTLPIECWAAADTVTLYYGRTAIENRFAAENREFGLDRVFSFSVPGQTVACAVAMAIWNFRILGGIAAVPETVPTRPDRLRPQLDQEDERAPAIEGVVEHSELSSEPTAQKEPAETATSQPEAANDVGADEVRSPEPLSGNSTTRCLPDLLRDWSSTHVDWTTDKEGTVLVCPDGHSLHLSGTRSGSEGKSYRYRIPGGFCNDCSKRDQCSPTSTAKKFRREVSIRPRIAPADQADTTPIVRPSTGLLHVLDQTPLLPRLIPDAPVLLPAELRKKTVTLAAQPSITVQLPKREKKEANSPEHVAMTKEERQRCRLTIAERIAMNAHPKPDRIVIQLAGSSDFVRWLKRLRRSSRSG
jgi:hypothetical protein